MTSFNYLIKNLLAGLFLAFATIGSAGILLPSNAVPAESVVSNLHTITVVPIEAPPFLVHPETAADRAALAAAGIAAPDASGGRGTIIPVTGVPLVNAAMVAIALVSIAGSSTTTKGDGVLTLTTEQPSGWMLTPSLAKDAAQLVQAAGRQQVSVIDGYAELPVSDRSVNVYMENWLGPIRRWYKSDTSELDYARHIALQPDAVLEVAIANYEYSSGHRLWLSVMVKLVDPATQKVIGRAVEMERPKGKPLAEMLQNEGQPLKDLIALMSTATFLDGDSAFGGQVS
jgi:hypothetical protein